MAKQNNLYEADGKWLFITPISNLDLTKAVQREIRIGRLILVDVEKFPKIRQRFRLKKRISELIPSYRDLMKGTRTIGIVRHNGKPCEIESQCWQIALDSLYILAISQLVYALRKNVSYPMPEGFGEDLSGTKLLFLDQNRKYSRMSKRIGSLRPLVLDKQWKDWQKRFFFCRLLKIIHSKTKVQREWKETLRRAVILTGKGLITQDIPQAFLMNMIALEMLLTVQGDKYSRELPKRVESFIGWVHWWKEDDCHKRLKRAYELRSGFVHDGKVGGIDESVLQFTDNLLFSVLTNLVSFPELFYSKPMVIEFCKKVEAEQLLGIPTRIQPKNLTAVRSL